MPSVVNQVSVAQRNASASLDSVERNFWSSAVRSTLQTDSFSFIVTDNFTGYGGYATPAGCQTLTGIRYARNFQGYEIFEPITIPSAECFRILESEGRLYVFCRSVETPWGGALHVVDE